METNFLNMPNSNHRSKGSLSFQNLHIDIQLSVIHFLRPSDVVSLSMSCKSLREASNHRSVWIPLLNSICLSNGLFMPTYTLHQMSVIEIQRVVFSPARMISLYNHHLCSSDRVWPSVSQRTILPGTLDTAGNFTRYLFLIPGGRFLVSYSGYWRHLCVWDLNVVSTNSANSQPLVKWKYRLQLPITCSQNPAGTAIRIAALARPLSEELLDTSQLHVFECQPGHSPPIIQIYSSGSPQHNADPILRFVSGDLFVEIDGPCIYMWNIVQNVWTCWKHGLDTVQAAFIEHGRIILIGLNWIRFWRIPGYDAWVSVHNVMRVDLVPDFILSINQPTNPNYHLARNHLSIYRTASSWYSGQSVAPLTFDIMEAGSTSEYFTVFYNCQPPTSDYDGDTDGRVDATATALIQDLNYGDFPIAWDSWRILDGQIFKYFSNYDTIQLLVSGNKVTKAAEKVYSYYDPVVDLVNTGDNLLQCDEFSFDPMSGRLCYASLSDEGSIVVLDFLSGGD